MNIGRWTRRRASDEGRGEPANDPPEGATGREQPADGFSEAGIREALRDVRDPEIGRDLISLNMVRGV